METRLKNWTIEEDDILRENYKEKTCMELVQILGRTPMAVSNRKHSLGLTTPRIKRIKICENCKKQYLGLPYQKFCSIKCGKYSRYIKKKKPLQIKTCKNCKKSFQPIHQRTVFCSNDCRKKYMYYKSKYPVIIKRCWVCGKIFETRRKTKHCCSIQCQYENQNHDKRLLINIMTFIEKFHPEIIDEFWKKD